MMRFDPTRFAAIGRPVRRKEDLRLLTGRGRFSDDVSLPGQAYAAMVRATLPHARIVAIDVAGALAMPGVLGVFTGADCRADGLRPIPHNPVPSTRHDLKLTAPGGGEIFIGPHEPLPIDRVRHVGEALAMVVARTRAEALDAAERVDVEYAPLPWVSDSTAASCAGAPCLWEPVPDNVCVDTIFGDVAATEAAFARADHVVGMRFRIGRVTAVPLEPRAALGIFDAGARRYTLYAGSGGAVRHKRELAAVLGEPADNLRVLCGDVGGNFGARNRVYVEYALVLWAARQLGVPVKFTATRSESFLSDYQGRDLVTDVSIALDGDGNFLALRATNLSNVGARIVSLSPLGKGSALVTGSYRIAAATVRARAAFSNTAPTQAYRSSGRPEVTYAIERLIDTAAAELGFDRVALRKRNLLSPLDMPYTNAVGATYDSGEYEANMDRAMAIADWAGFPAREAEARARGMLLGIGVANYVESSIGSPRERAEITVQAGGRIRVVVGTQPSGQGHETSFAQVTADLLGIPVDVVDIVLGDTDIVSVGGGSHSGRSMRHAGTVIYLAAGDLVAQARHLAAHLFGCDQWEVRFDGGLFQVEGTNLALDILELAREAAHHDLPEALAGALAVARDNEMHTPVYPNGCSVCEVEVDPETGSVRITRYASVDDAGRVINPMIVHGQTHGAIAQGVGQALWEQCYVDPGSGQPLCGSFLDYAVPRADELPFFVTELNEVLSPTNPLGIKAGGEGGTTPAPAVVINAVVHALRAHGVRDIPMPATPYQIWRAIQEAGGAAASGH